jgi:hypothetical protein
MKRLSVKHVLAFTVVLPITPAWGAAPCFFSPEKAGEAVVVQDGSQSVTLTGPRAFENCLAVVVTKGVAKAQYVDVKGKATSQPVLTGKGVNPANLGQNAAPVRAVSRSLLAMLTDPNEQSKVGQKYFEKPAQIGAPFGDVYIPPEGLIVRFSKLEGDARIQVADAASNAPLFEATVAQGMTLDRSRLRPGGKYTVRVVSAREKIPPGAFEVVSQEVATDLEQALKAIDADPLLDTGTRPIARALAFEQEGLSFNREIALRELKK